MNTALAKTLLHFIWEGGLIALALALVLKVVRPVFAQLRYGAACMAMLAMLAAFGATLVRFWPHTEKLPPPVIDFRWSQSPMEAPTPPPAPRETPCSRSSAAPGPASPPAGPRALFRRER